MNQIKPEVSHYVQTEYEGEVFHYLGRFTREQMKKVSVSDLEITGIKSKFRPVYKEKV